MILEPRCSERRCKHFLGVKQDDGREETERCVCKAFPDGIPPSIAYGADLHLVPRATQGNDIAFEER